MIFVTTGTLQIVFSRLIDYMCEFSNLSDEKMIIQCGKYAFQPIPKVTFIPYCTIQQMKYYYSSADRIIAATGEGSLFQILHYSKHLAIYFPRLKKFHEHVDNQQFITAQSIKICNLGLVALNKAQLFKALSQKPKYNPYKNKSLLENRALIEFLDKLTTGII